MQLLAALEAGREDITGCDFYGPMFVDASAGCPYYFCMLDAILESLPFGRTASPWQEMLDVVRILEAPNQSTANAGTPVSL